MGLKNLPSVDEVLRDSKIAEKEAHFSRELVVNEIRRILGNLREEIIQKDVVIDRELARDKVVQEVLKNLGRLRTGTLRQVLNGTGVVLHTNLGRAPLVAEAFDHSLELAKNYTNLELDLDTGKRGSRYYHLESMILKITGAEAALVVNNNAAAVLLVLNTLARDKEVIVSRGQLVEIGGSFRIPEIMSISGATLVEAGTTNKTYISDFAENITENTAALLAVHTSNYRIVGFSQEVALDELVRLGRSRDLPVVQDLGSGSLLDLSAWGLEYEPTVTECLQFGVDVVTFSGDKLLGGPQAGIIVGKRSLIEKMKKNHLLRALRVDKMTIAALESTLRCYIDGNPHQTVPVLEMLTYSTSDLEDKANQLGTLIQDVLRDWEGEYSIRVVETQDKVGGGAYPLQVLPGFGVEIQFDFDPEVLARQLRLQEPAILLRIQEGALLLSVRTLRGNEVEVIPGLLLEALRETVN